jgi:regulator of RNase E activity RraA
VVGEVPVAPGDVVFGDSPGVPIVPAGLADEVFERAMDKSHGENQVRGAFREGMSAVEAFGKFGVM